MTAVHKIFITTLLVACSGNGSGTKDAVLSDARLDDAATTIDGPVTPDAVSFDAKPAPEGSLDPSEVAYKGYFQMPGGSTFSYGSRELTYVPDCMGETDPSSADGYPGCLLGVTLDKNVVLTDIPVPTPLGENIATEILAEWDVTGTMPEANGYTGSGSEELSGLYYEQGPPCRIWWMYIQEYAIRPADDDPILAYSDCSTTNPNPQGMWTLDQSEGDQFRATSYYHITRAPASIATTFFGGKEMVLGPGKSSGSRTSSLGPSLAVRPWTVPTASADNTTPLIYYPSAGGYPRWYNPTVFRGATDTQTTLCARTPGGEFFQVGTKGAYVTMGQRSVVNLNEYPANDPVNAGPTEAGYEGRTYATEPTWPDPLTVPVYWVRYRDLRFAS